MFKNAASQSVALFAFDTTTGAPKTGDSANMVFYITKDWGSVTAVAASSGVPTEMDATNAKGWYKIAVSQTESNADAILFSGKSSTANISVVGVLLQTVPAGFTALTTAAIATGVWQDTTAGDFTTALSIGKSVMNGVSLGTGLTINGYTGNTPQTGDNFARLGAPAGASIAADLAEIEAETDTLLAGVTVTTNNDKTGYALTAGERTSVADALLDRDMSTGADSGSTTVRTVRNALRFLRNKWSISGTTMTVCKEDDTTTAWTSTLSTTAGANPVTTSDPAG